MTIATAVVRLLAIKIKTNFPDIFVDPIDGKESARCVTGPRAWNVSVHVSVDCVPDKPDHFWWGVDYNSRPVHSVRQANLADPTAIDTIYAVWLEFHLTAKRLFNG